jgi:cation diffusion facilitator family transporter
MKQRTALLSVGSNSALILLKMIAGILTGSVAILTEAVHSSVDLIASLVAFLSLRIADEPADEGHRYGHEKVENLAAAFEAMLILVGSLAIAFEAVRRLVIGGSTHTLGLGIAVIGFSAGLNVVIGAAIARGGRLTDSPALQGDAAHLLTDAASSAVVLAALILVDLTGAQWIDPVAALLVSVVILATGVRLLVRAGEVLVDQSLPAAEIEQIVDAIEGSGEQAVIGFHELRTRRGGSKRYVDVHIQFRSGTSLEQAHRIAHELQHGISTAIGGADVLIHLEPQDRLRPGQHGLPDADASSDDPVRAQPAPEGNGSGQ